MKNKIILVLIFILADLGTGLLKAIQSGTYTSSKMREGLFHKLAELASVAFGYLCDYALPIIGVELPVRLASGVIVYVIIMECGSIIENIGVMSPSLGKYLSGVFEKVKNDD